MFGHKSWADFISVIRLSENKQKTRSSTLRPTDTMFSGIQGNDVPSPIKFLQKNTHRSLAKSFKRCGFASHSIVWGKIYLNCFQQWLCRQLSATNFQTLKQSLHSFKMCTMLANFETTFCKVFFMAFRTSWLMSEQLARACLVLKFSNKNKKFPGLKWEQKLKKHQNFFSFQLFKSHPTERLVNIFLQS